MVLPEPPPDDLRPRVCISSTTCLGLRVSKVTLRRLTLS